MTLNKNSFIDVTSGSGITWSRQRGDESFNVNWIDFNNDGLQDLWVIGHSSFRATPRNLRGKFPALYINQGDGTFDNISTQYWRTDNGGDSHGTTWIDFDNDGDLDVLRIGGGALGGALDEKEQANAFFVNNGQVDTDLITSTILSDEAEERNLEYSIARGRSSLWVDVNGDGLLDVIQLNGLRLDGQGGSAYIEQKANGTFKDPVDLNLPPSRYAQLGDLTGDGSLEIVVQGTFEYPIAVYDISDGTLNDISDRYNNFPLTSSPTVSIDSRERDFSNKTSARDSIIADFDNDGDNDLFLTRSDVSLDFSDPSAFRAGSRVVVADLRNQGKEVGFSFETSGEIAVDLADINEQSAKINLPSGIVELEASRIFIGAEGRNPTTAELNAFLDSSTNRSVSFPIPNDNDPRFVIDRNSPGVAGLKSDRSEVGFYIGYDTTLQQWEGRLSSGSNELVRAIVESTTTVNNVRTINFANPGFEGRALTDQLWKYNSDTEQFVDTTDSSGLSTPTLAQSAVAADFDNDKDIDIYISNHFTTVGLPNILYENNGDGTFTTVEMAGGAAGVRVGPTHLDFNYGQRLAIADYDNNGFVDIFAGSTTLKSPAKTYLGTPPQLYKNQGNSNNWILLDLEGTESNRDGIGAQVKLTSGGVTQLREQNSGVHAFAQNDSRLHFGLAEDNVIERIEISWSSGNVQVLEDVSVNQVLTVTEVSASGSNSDSTNPTPGNDNLSGTEADDLILGLRGSDTIDGNGGNDTLRGGDGNDTIIGGSGRDVLREQSNSDITITNNRLIARGTDTFSEIEVVNVDGGNSSQTIDASAVTNFQVIVQALEGRDTVIGGSQNDVIVGGSDSDFLTGGDGADNFVYQQTDHGGDTIADFESGSGGDIIFISAAAFGGGLNPGFVPADRFTVGCSATDSDDRLIYNSSNGEVLFDPDGNQSDSEIKIATLSDRPELTANNVAIF